MKESETAIQHKTLNKISEAISKNALEYAFNIILSDFRIKLSVIKIIFLNKIIFFKLI